MGMGIIILVLALSIGITGCAAADPSPNHTKTLVLLYLVGSDLESKSGAGTSDLLTILDSYGSTDSKKLDFVVAFGGSKKSGWNGMKIATIGQLKEDAKDEQFGNGRDYLFSDLQADMGSGRSFSQFLSTAMVSRTGDRNILIISDHGGSYSGIGMDERTSNLLLMDDIDKALKDHPVSFDPIIFDACLMGSVEVAKTVKPYTKLMFGSEEIQWGSYDYESLVGPLTKNPSTDTKTLSTMLADSYIRRNAEDANIKTSSIIDATKVPAIRDSLDKLGTKLIPVVKTEEGLHDLKAAYNNAIRLGVTDGDAGTSVDLVSLMTNIGKKRPELNSDTQKIIALAKKAVIFEKHNSYSQSVCGISIAAPDAMNIQQYDKYGQGVKIGPKWDEFFRTMVIHSQENAQESESTEEEKVSEIVPVTSGSGTVISSINNGADLSRPAFTDKGNGAFQLEDPYQDASIYAAFYKVNGPELLEIGTIPITKGVDGLYRIPAWDGRWYYLKDTSGKGMSLLVDLVYNYDTVDGHNTYFSWISLDSSGYATNASLVTFVKQGTNLPQIMISPCYENEDRAEVLGDGMNAFGQGTRVTSYTDAYNTASKNTVERTLGTGTAGPQTTISYSMLPDGTYAAGIMAYYDNDEPIVTDEFRLLTIRNGAITSSSIGPIP